MEADARVIEHLSQGLRQELAAANQLRRHSWTRADWGRNDFATKRQGKSIEERENDVAVKHDIRNLHQGTAGYCVSIVDRVSKGLFEELMADEECHIALSETQLLLIGRIGSEPHAPMHVGEPGKEEGHD